MCGHMYHDMWRSEGYLQELVLVCHHVGSRNQIHAGYQDGWGSSCTYWAISWLRIFFCVGDKRECWEHDHIYTGDHVYAYIYTYIGDHIYVGNHIYTYVCIYVCMYIHWRQYILGIIYTGDRIHTHTYTYIHTGVIYVYTYIHGIIYVYIFTHTYWGHGSYIYVCIWDYI